MYMMNKTSVLGTFFVVECYGPGRVVGFVAMERQGRSNWDQHVPREAGQEAAVPRLGLGVVVVLGLTGVVLVGLVTGWVVR